MSQEREILSGPAIGRALSRIASEIVERNGGVEDVALVGIRTRGVPLAERLAEGLARTDGREVPLGLLDITLYRDDLTPHGSQPVVQSTDIDFDVSRKTIVLVDDVLYTGRTVRAAMDALVALGRPRRIQLAVLVDRGHREFPIAADHVGCVVQTAFEDDVRVELKETDGRDRVTLRPASTVGEA